MNFSMLGSQAALRRAEEEKARLCAALDTMRADMEAILHAAVPAKSNSPGLHHSLLMDPVHSF